MKQLILCLAWLFGSIVSISTFADDVVNNDSLQQDASPQTVYMVVWRGCEDACKGFQSYLKESGVAANVIVRNANRSKSNLSGFVEEAKALNPDLVVTWGTTVSKGVIGTIEEFGETTKLGDIPVLFMIVADPIGANIVDSYEHSGRKTVTGIRNRVPDEVQIRAMREYFPVERIGVIYSEAELNSTLNTDNLQKLSKTMKFELFKELYKLDDKGKPYPNQFDTLMSSLSEKNVDVVYVGSSSYNLDHADEFTSAALKYKIPVASAYDSMVTNSNALISVSNKYYRVGRFAGSQAKKILVDGDTPGDLEVASLSQFSISINMSTAKLIDLYPPIHLIRFADLVNVQH
ncbi:ABC transporter substrate-binding protein [Marinomonas sp. 2405UD68-3]|uniref:ABC transporter substrate-binding protein n=1 Tax=Marinomonas sp. 2405UD68-3 TaxID=3391835 RepID=UPI0039C977F3